MLVMRFLGIYSLRFVRTVNQIKVAPHLTEQHRLLVFGTGCCKEHVDLKLS